jgi:hypothetical protein
MTTQQEFYIHQIIVKKLLLQYYVKLVTEKGTKIMRKK